MSRIIYKHPLGDNGVTLAGKHKVLLVGVDPKLTPATVCIWVEHEWPIDTDPHWAPRTQYLIMGTGFTMEDDDSFHVGSAITPTGYVWHVYGKTL